MKFGGTEKGPTNDALPMNKKTGFKQKNFKQKKLIPVELFSPFFFKVNFTSWV
jgi:hypothetical protein